VSLRGGLGTALGLALEITAGAGATLGLCGAGDGTTMGASYGVERRRPIRESDRIWDGSASIRPLPGASVGALDGASCGAADGTSNGTLVGTSTGTGISTSDGAYDGTSCGSAGMTWVLEWAFHSVISILLFLVFLQK
jgi:hypothetical protein